MSDLEVHDIKVVLSVDTPKYCYRITKKELVKGDETFPFTSLERFEIMETMDGKQGLSRRNIKSVSLPNDPEVLFKLGEMCISLSGLSDVSNTPDEIPKETQKKIPK